MYKNKGLFSFTTLLFIILTCIPVLVFKLTLSFEYTAIAIIVVILINISNYYHLMKDIDALIAKTQEFAEGKIEINDKRLDSLKQIDILDANINNMAKLMSNIMIELQKRSNELEDQNSELEKMAHLDSLTKTYNKGYCEKMIEKLENMIGKNKIKSMSVLFVDIDYFKKVNDTYGHKVGDIALCHVADLVKSTIRQNDILARYGGEEFILLLINTPLINAVGLGERLREIIEENPVETTQGKISLTISLGAAEKWQDETIKETINRADQKLYIAKNGGRNRVEY